MRPLAAAVVGLIAIVASFEACSTRYDGTPASTEADAGADTGAGAEGGSAVDAGADVTAVPFCATRPGSPQLCVDWDVATTPEDFATFHDINPIGVAAVSALDKGLFVSPPASLSLSVPAAVPGNNDGLTNRMGFKLGVVPTSAVHVECELRIGSDDAQKRAYVLWTSFGGGRALYLYTSRIEAGIVVEFPADAGGMQLTKPFKSPLALGKWIHTELDVTFSPTPTLTVRLDGGVVLDAVALDGAFASPGAPTVSVGPGFFTSSFVTRTELSFDDLLVTYAP